MKKVVLSMDVEDWFHLDYVHVSDVSQNFSMLDGLDNYQRLLERYNLKSSFFCLDEILQREKVRFRDLYDTGHDIGSHGATHIRPLLMSISDFTEEMKSCYQNILDITNSDCIGYRAPCFSLDEQRLKIIEKIGFKFDASKIDFGIHPLYGQMTLRTFDNINKFVYKRENFFVFEANTCKFYNKSFPSSGGGYLRMFPWKLTKFFLNEHIKNADFYNLYIHPFELSHRSMPDPVRRLPYKNRLRFSLGRRKTLDKLERLINLFGESGYQFTTYSALRSSVLC